MATLKLAGLEINQLTVTTMTGITVECNPTNDRIYPGNKFLTPTVYFDTKDYPQRECIILWKNGGEITDSMITRADTGSIIILENEVASDRVYLVNHGITGKATLSIDSDFDTCITFNLNSVIGSNTGDHYFVCYRPSGSNEAFRIQRFSRHYYNGSTEIRKIGIKLYKIYNQSSYSSAGGPQMEIEVYALDGTDFYNHENLRRLKPVMG
ncbi:MAG: hypothetical protein K1X92_17210 [Bacteroidia bacterium]|nr:hypothetical protein [Bacteroidia bacterium]